jgi:hypothetical protein
MNPKHEEVRCSNCGALLAKREPAGMTIRRGDLEAILTGAFQMTLRCYRPHCRQRITLNHANGALGGTRATAEV